MIWRFAAIVPLAVLAGLFGTWAGDRTPPIHIESVIAETKSVPPGGELKVRYTVNRVRSCTTRIQKMIQDAGGKYETSDDQEILAVLRPLGHDSYVSSTIIPKNFERGPAWYRSGRKYDCNPLHAFWPITVLVADIPFMIEGEVAKEPLEVVPRR